MRSMSFSYFPGCSQSGSAEEFGLSTLAVCDALGITLEELPDWNCCGASSAHMTNELLALSLPGRNLAIAAGMDMDLITVCANCYSRMQVARQRILADESVAREVEDAVGSDPRFSGEIRHLLDVLVNDIGIPEIKKWRRVSLEGLKPVPYYGCLLVRPPEVCCLDSAEDPTELDRLLEGLGAEVRQWSFKTDCCGGSLTLSRTDVVAVLVNRLFERAEEAGANCIVTCCPMCLGNLEMRQKPGKLSFSPVHGLPVLYFTEVLALAMGLPVEEWLKCHLIDPRPVLSEAGLL